MRRKNKGNEKVLEALEKAANTVFDNSFFMGCIKICKQGLSGATTRVIKGSFVVKDIVYPFLGALLAAEEKLGAFLIRVYSGSIFMKCAEYTVVNLRWIRIK